jgi:hypothetical protein
MQFQRQVLKNMSLVILYLHDVHKMKAVWSDRVSICPSVRVFQLENRWADFDEIWYGCFAI